MQGSPLPSEREPKNIQLNIPSRLQQLIATDLIKVDE
jgi:hypothetical protein